MRTVPPFFAGVPAPERSLFTWFYDAGKRGITLDWRQPDGGVVLRRLAAEADVLVETEPPGGLAALGCGPEALRQTNPGLVVASITPFGQQGPRRDWRSSDTVAQALGGMLFVNGHPDGPPLRALGLQAYHQAGVFAAIGVVSALLARERDRSRAGRRREPSGGGHRRPRARPGLLAPGRSRRGTPGHAPLDALLPGRPLPRRLGHALHARRLDLARRVGEGRRHGRRPRRPALRRHQGAAGRGRASLRRSSTPGPSATRSPS